MTTMNPRIIYPTPDGGVAIIIPTGELPIEEVARQVVPQGVPYAYVDASEIPEDRTFRAAWSADFPGAADYFASFAEPTSEPELEAEVESEAEPEAEVEVEVEVEPEATLESESQVEPAVCEVEQ